MSILSSIGSIFLEVGKDMINECYKSQDAYERYSTFDDSRLKSEWKNREHLSAAERNGLAKVIKERLGK